MILAGHAGWLGNTRNPAFLVFAVLCGPLGAGLLAALADAGLVAVPAMGGTLPVLFAELVVAPVLEEMAFQGALQDWLADQAWARPAWAGLSVANVLTSMVFALFHLAGHATALALLTVFPSLLLGKTRDNSGSLAACAGLHAWFNLCYGLVFVNWR